MPLQTLENCIRGCNSEHFQCWLTNAKGRKMSTLEICRARITHMCVTLECFLVVIRGSVWTYGV